MPMPKGVDHQLGEVNRAKEEVSGPQKHKPAH
jgi:hypothetical protein